MAYTTETLFPRGRFHIIAGASGAGSTSFALLLLRQWQAGGEWLDCRFSPSPVCIVSAVHPTAALKALIRHLDLPDTTPLASLLSGRHSGDWSFDGAVGIAQERMGHRSGVILIDGLAMLCPRVNDDKVVVDFLVDAARTCERLNLCVIGTLRASKFGVDGQHQSPVERIIGSGYWVQVAGTRIFVDYVKPRDPENSDRHVYAIPRVARPRKFAYAFGEDGILRETSTATEMATTTALDEWLAAWDPDEPLTTARILEEGLRLGMAERTVEAWIMTQCDDDPESLGTLHRLRKGIYQARRMV